jgi:hypothetical protein
MGMLTFGTSQRIGCQFVDYLTAVQYGFSFELLLSFLLEYHVEDIVS